MEVKIVDEVVQSSSRKEMNRRDFLQKTTMVVGAAVGAALVNSLTGLPVSAVSSSSVMNSNGTKPDLVFPVISDVHIKSNNNQTLDKFVTTLEQLNQISPNQDAFVVVGDLTDNGLTPEYDKFFNEYNVKKQVQAVSMFAIGNHDYWNGLPVADAQKRFLEKTGMESIYFHQMIKGYHFIILGTEDGVTEGTFNEQQIGWLAERLKQAAADDPHKPIFVFHHQPIMDTIYGSEWGFTKNRDLFYDTLKPYPQVISFSGHTHYPLDDPRIIHQKDFTSIGTSTGAYLWLDAGRIQGEVPEGADILNQAMIVEVHHNKVLIKRRDIHQNDWTGEPFEISYPAKPNKFTYTEDRDKKAPYFAKDAMISIVEEDTAAAGLTVMLTQAKDNLLVHDYKLKAKNMETGKVDKEILAFSEFYKDPIPNPLSLDIYGLQSNTLYEIEVSALDAFANESQNSLKVLGKTKQGPVIILSKNELNGIDDQLDVIVENVRISNGDWVGVYEVNEKPGNVASIWWMNAKVTGGRCTFTYDPKNNAYPARYSEGKTYKLVYFYGSGYDAVAETTFTVK
ncbi:phosphatase/fibronectin domain-containing protein [Neobacillus bataviensis LMG 21833]|uniref:Phosphatase/fibronectin domain-containing protein n=1 Tax=Neobacillus bataviensis LMG 21833 TaxID=1117379 RepID=K6DEE3_9BACI|nr:metallophosphoesterase [Neobacillus bataviensis]EKN66684.1 phosphatase/fibronectin domain-containing protein [Neobacillus bataviensis LMG 21833]